MTVNITNIENRINEIVAQGNLTPSQVSQFTYIAENIYNFNNTVATASSLPAAADNKGRLFYVEDEGIFKVSNGVEWLYPTNSATEESRVWTWGDNTRGQLGDNTTISRSSPGTTAGGGTTWSQVSAGNQHTVAVKTDGTLWTWGLNTSGQLGTGNTTARSSPVTTAGGGTTWSQVSAGGFHTAAIKTDGMLWTWGYNGYGQLGDNTQNNRSSPVTTAGGGTTWSQVNCGWYHTAAIKTDGTLWTWGYNGYGRLGDNTTTDRRSPITTAGGGTTWSQVSAGGFHTAAITNAIFYNGYPT